MNGWQHLTDLGSLNVTAPIAVAIAAWLGVAHCVRLAAYWTAVFLTAMFVVVASKLAFLGWGIGFPALDFAGFSGHAARAAAIFPVALGLLLHRQPPRLRNQGVLAGVLIAVAVAASRVVVGAHSVAEAVTGCLLGLAAALLFIDRARATVNFRPGPILVAITLSLMLLLPKIDPRMSQQWLVAAALTLSGSDRVWQRPAWQPAPTPYIPPCAPEKVRWTWLCTWP